MDEFGRVLPPSHGSQANSGPQSDRQTTSSVDIDRRGGYDGYGSRDIEHTAASARHHDIPHGDDSSAWQHRRTAPRWADDDRRSHGRDAPRWADDDRRSHGRDAPRWADDDRRSHGRDAPRWVDDDRRSHGRDAPRWADEGRRVNAPSGGYGAAAAAAAHHAPRAHEYNQHAPAPVAQPSTPAALPDVADGSALLHRYLAAAVNEEVLNRAWFHEDGYVSVVVLRPGELHADPCAVVQFETPHHAKGALAAVKAGSARKLARALQGASADPSRQPWLAVYHPPRAMRQAAAQAAHDARHPITSTVVAPPKGIGVAPTAPQRFTADSTAYSLDSSSGMFWDGSRGWFACPRAQSVLYLHADTGQYAMFNGIDFLPFTPSAPSEAPPPVPLLRGTPGTQGEQPTLRCAGSGYAVQRKRGILLCALCRRRFRSADELTAHLQRSSLHAGNVRKVQQTLKETGNTSALKKLNGLVQGK